MFDGILDLEALDVARTLDGEFHLNPALLAEAIGLSHGLGNNEDVAEHDGGVQWEAA